MSVPNETIEVKPMTLVLVDLSSIAYPIWHTTQSSSNANEASQQIVARVRSLASSQKHVAICCDKGKSFRHDISSTYKANRPEHEATLHHQIRLATEALEADGFPIWTVAGFEADDLIATAACRAMELDGAEVVIVSADKDLLQLVGDAVTALSVRDGNRIDADAVFAKFGVKPAQIRDYLTLVGDASDNVKGVKGIGPTKAADLLSRFGTIDGIYRALDSPGTSRITPAMATALREFTPHLETTQKLITLRTDVDLPFNDILRERQPRTTATFGEFNEDDMETTPETTAADQPVDDTPNSATPTIVPPAALVRMPPQEPDVLAPAPSEWEKQLEPRSMRETIALAKHVHESRLFSAYGTPQAVMTTLLAGREMGLQSMAALRAIHIIDGKPTLSADLIRALILRSGKAQYFLCKERIATRATFVTKRGDDPEIELTVTIEEARQAWTKDEAAWLKSGWGKNPADMLVARAGAKLARLVYPDVVHGVYTPEEMDESRTVVV